MNAYAHHVLNLWGWISLVGFTVLLIEDWPNIRSRKTPVILPILAFQIAVMLILL